MSNALFEMVPNISEGRSAGTIDACVAAAQQFGGRVLHRTSDPVHHRSVVTIVGSYDELLDASVALAGVVLQTIDLRTHHGVHPRIGALDVLPFVPLRDASMQDAVALAREAGARIWEVHRIPSYLYGEAASTPLRRNLAAVRAGEFEGLDARFALPEWLPDFGDPHAHERAGAIAIGAREILIAFNVELATGDLRVAQSIARRIRQRNGGLTSLKAIGLRISERLVQVSLNITDYRATPLYRVTELIRALAAAQGIAIVRSELIGCVPLQAIEETAAYYIGATTSNGCAVSR
ncbi:MAG: glutamate formimidoyltransferase [Candidatus Eremiobacteraeota bacterium]|nr:glutamate formimidoyltransferase [Candidatus Eremiobacteraeota bacterium]